MRFLILIMSTLVASAAMAQDTGKVTHCEETERYKQYADQPLKEGDVIKFEFTGMPGRFEYLFKGGFKGKKYTVLSAQGSAVEFDIPAGEFSKLKHGMTFEIVKGQREVEYKDPLTGENEKHTEKGYFAKTENGKYPIHCKGHGTYFGDHCKRRDFLSDENQITESRFILVKTADNASVPTKEVCIELKARPVNFEGQGLEEQGQNSTTAI